MGFTCDTCGGEEVREDVEIHRCDQQKLIESLTDNKKEQSGGDAGAHV